jgi:hypothetical protein
MNRSHRLASIIGIAVVLAGLLTSKPLSVEARPLGDVLTLQSNSNSDVETYINSGAATTNYGTSAVMRVGENNAGTDVNRALIDFNFAAIPATATINTAKLTIWVHADYTSNARQFCIYRLKRAWTESGATWNKYDASNSWQTAGAVGADDYDSTVPLGCSTLADGLTDGTAVIFTLDPLEFEKLTNGTYTDYGFLIKADTESDDMYEFLTSDNANAGKRPKLVVDYNIDVIDDIWSCVNLKGPAGVYTCNAPYNQPMSPYMVVGNGSTAGGGKLTDAKIECTPRPDCINDSKIYYRVEFTYSWSWSSSITESVTINTSGATGPQHSEVFACGTGTSGSCQGVSYGQIFTSELPTSDGTFDVTTGLTHISIPAAAPSNSLTYTIFYSRMPFDEDCADKYLILTTDGPQLIDPVIEAPLGPLGSPADEQLYTTIPNVIYAVQTAGGPWNNNGADNFDAAISWDGVEWIAMKDYDALCVVTDPLNPELLTIYIAALSDTFYIRANDVPGNFADNYTLTGNDFQYFMSIAVGQSGPDCPSQFAYDPEVDLLISVSVHSYDAETQAGVDFTPAITPGDWYAIEVTSGTWSDGNQAANIQLDFDFRPLPPVTSDFLDLTEGSVGVWCQLSNIAFVQASAERLFLRANDDDEDLGDNVGTLEVNVYHASFTRRPETCELTFGLSDFWNSGTIDAKQENGILIGESVLVANTGGIATSPSTIKLEAGGWYMLETTGGPWGWVGGNVFDQTKRSYDIAIADALNNWVPLEDWEEAECNVAIDALGHRRLFFQVPPLTDVGWRLRVGDDAGWFNNFGHMGYNLYKAYDQQVELPDGTCDYAFDSEHPAGGAYIDATHEDGDNMPTLEANTIYAVEIQGSSYFWQESIGGEHLYGMQLSDDNGATWNDLPNGYGGVLCTFQPTGVDTIFFLYTGSHYLYKMRVDSTSFGDNVGGMGIQVYVATPGDTVNPWTSCMDGLAKSIVDSHEWIDVKKVEGQRILINTSYSSDDKVLGFVVEIEIPTGPWRDGETDTEHYNADISSDNGTTWYPLDSRDNPDIICAKDDLIHRYVQAYFAVENEQVWKIRVGDDDTETFTDNTGNLGYKLWAVTETNTTPDCLVDTNRADCLPPGVAIAINGQDACSFAIIRPTLDILDIGKSISDTLTYVTDIMLQYMAWCPKHTDALISLFNLFKNVEPIATLTELQQIIDETKKQIESYNWDDDVAPDTIVAMSDKGSFVEQVMDKVLPINSSPWQGGPLITSLAPSHPTNYYYSCVATVADVLGPKLPEGICLVSAAARETGISFWLQLAMDIAAAAWVLQSIRSDAANLASWMAGGGMRSLE